MRTIKINDEFKTLIPPLSHKEYIQLEENILTDGCREPIILWNDYIIDGHNRFAICTKHHIPFKTIEMKFLCKEDVIAWICKNQLGRRNITEETRKYLIGVQYNNEKIVNRIHNFKGNNQYTNKDNIYGRHRTAGKIASEHNLNSGTVQNYGSLAKAIDKINDSSPELANKILSGKYKISKENILAISNMAQSDISKINFEIAKPQNSTARYSNTKEIIEPRAQIKNMPTYDPDARAIELCLTIPSWISSIERAKTNINVSELTLDTKGRLYSTLESLNNKTLEIISQIKELL